VVANVTGSNTLAFVDIKVAELAVNSGGDDVDAYALLDVFKINEDMSIGIDFADVRIRPAQSELQNVSLNFNGKFGIVKIMAQADMQAGKTKFATTETKFKGKEIVVQGNVLLDPVTINFLLAQGSGNKVGFVAATDDNKAFVNFLDINPRYTFLYEYKIAGASGGVHQGFANTTVISLGAMFAVGKSLNLGLDVYDLIATEKILNGMGEESDEIGIEVDAKVNWKLYDNLTWNWDFGYFMPGKAYKTSTGKDDPAMGVQGILALKF
jgi:hypothetical protein